MTEVGADYTWGKYKKDERTIKLSNKLGEFDKVHVFGKGSSPDEDAKVTDKAVVLARGIKSSHRDATVTVNVTFTRDLEDKEAKIGYAFYVTAYKAGKSVLTNYDVKTASAYGQAAMDADGGRIVVTVPNK